MSYYTHSIAVYDSELQLTVDYAANISQTDQIPMSGTVIRMSHGLFNVYITDKYSLL